MYDGASRAINVKVIPMSDDSFMAVSDTTNDSVLHSAFSSDLISEMFMKRIRFGRLMYII